MPTPTATIYLPYHALDEVHQRGTRAAQPAAPTVVPGTLYCVTDEGDVVERSSGTAWEAYSPVPSGPVVEYDFSTATTAPPAAREIRFNAASPYTTVTTIWPRVLSANGTDVRAALAAQPAGVTLYVQQKDDATRYGKFQTTAEGIDQGDYFAFAVAWVANGAALVNNQPVAVQFAGGGSGGGGTGDVTGPASAVDHSVALYSGTTGKVLTDASQVTIDAAMGNLTTPGNITAGGLSTTPLNASNLTSGTVPDARFPATLPAVSGVNVTNLNATNLASGTVADARLSSNVPLKNVANYFSANQYIDRAAPMFYFIDESQPVDAKVFRVVATAQQFIIDSFNDALTVQGGVLRFTRTGDLKIDRDLYEKQRTTPLGHWIDVPYNAANFTTNIGTWTVTSGNVLTYAYCLIGKTIILSCYITGTSTSGAPTELRIALPGGFTASRYQKTATTLYDAGFATGIVTAGQLPAQIVCIKAPATAFGTTSVEIYFTFPFRID